MDDSLEKQEQPLPILTKEQLIERALESEKAIVSKDYITLEELEEEMKNW